MSALYAFAGVWTGVAAIVFVAAIVLIPPRDVRQLEAALRVSLGWPWYLGRAVADVVLDRHGEDAR